MRDSYPQGEWTWEEFADAAAKLHEKHGDPAQWKFGASLLYHTNILETLVLSRGGRLVSPDGSTIRGYLDSEETIAALEWAADNIHHRKIFAPMTDYGFRRLFCEGRMGMIVDYTDVFPMLVKRMGDSFGVAHLPRFRDGKRINVAASAGLGISAASRNPDMAWAFIRETLINRSALNESYAEIEVGNSYALLRELGHDMDARRSVFIAELQHAVPSAGAAAGLWNLFFKRV